MTSYKPEEIELLKRHEEQIHGIKIQKINDDLTYVAVDYSDGMPVGGEERRSYKGRIDPNLAKMIINNARLAGAQLPDATKKYVAGLIENFVEFAETRGIDVKNSAILYTQNPDFLPITLTLAQERLEEEARKLRHAYRIMTGIDPDKQIVPKLGYMKFIRNKEEGIIEDIQVEHYTLFSDQRKMRNFSEEELRVANELTRAGYSPTPQELKRLEIREIREREHKDSVRRILLNIIRDSGIAPDEETLEKVLKANSPPQISSLITEYQITKRHPKTLLKINIDSETGKLLSSRKE